MRANRLRNGAIILRERPHHSRRPYPHAPGRWRAQRHGATALRHRTPTVEADRDSWTPNASKEPLAARAHAPWSLNVAGLRLSQERPSAVRSDAFRRYVARGFPGDMSRRCTLQHPQIVPCIRMPGFRMFGN
jgi:hypothetical protein